MNRAMRQLIIMAITAWCSIFAVAKDIEVADIVYAPNYTLNDEKPDTVCQIYRVPLLTFKDNRTARLADELFTTILTNIPYARTFSLQLDAIGRDTVWSIMEHEVPDPIIEQNAYGVYFFNYQGRDVKVLLTNDNPSFTKLKEDVTPTDKNGRPYIIDDIFDVSDDTIVFNTKIIYARNVWLKDVLNIWNGILSPEKNEIELIRYYYGYDRYENSYRLIELYKVLFDFYSEEVRGRNFDNALQQVRNMFIPVKKYMPFVYAQYTLPQFEIEICILPRDSNYVIWVQYVYRDSVRYEEQFTEELDEQELLSIKRAFELADEGTDNLGLSSGVVDKSHIYIANAKKHEVYIWNNSIRMYGTDEIRVNRVFRDLDKTLLRIATTCRRRAYN